MDYSWAGTVLAVEGWGDGFGGWDAAVGAGSWSVSLVLGGVRGGIGGKVVSLG